MRLLNLYKKSRLLQQENERLKAELAALQPVKRLDAPDLEFAFKDLDGKSYYRIPATLDFPLERFGKSNQITQFMSAGLNGTEQRVMLGLLEKEFEKMVAGKGGSLINCGAIVKEMLNRLELIVHTDLLYEFLAVHRIRQDEPVYKYVEEIQQEKIQAFQRMVREAGTSYPFFQVPELLPVTESFNQSQGDWEERWNHSMTEIASLRKKVQYLKSVAKSKPERKTSEISL